MADEPRISVVIAAFQAEAFLAEAVQSALWQTRAPLEIVIVDDASTDATLTVAERLADRYGSVRVFGLAENHGPAATRNHGIRQCRGDWIAILDDDDAFEPDRLEKIGDFLVENEGQIDIVSDLLTWIRNDGAVAPDFEIDQLAMPIGLAEFIVRSRPLLPTPDLGLLKPVFRKAFLDERNLYYPANHRHGEDYLLMVTALTAGARYHVLPWYGYRYTDRSVGRSRTRVDYRCMRQADEALRAWPQIRSDAAASRALEQRMTALRELELEMMPVYRKLLRGEIRRVYWDLARRLSS
ncbi:glycosyltransferase family 2 protein [Salinisphaera sp. SPP-AMP-43]|uniref:glycosyltransferase family 2 protein n=1 Tax=Salinisphaera sp. SPP-AMP-43 TaxID=3121288 RepID=UPI003C6E52DF